MNNFPSVFLLLALFLAVGGPALGDFYDPGSGQPVTALPAQLAGEGRIITNPSWEHFYAAGWRKIARVPFVGSTEEAARALKTVTGYSVVTNSAGEEIFQEIASFVVRPLYFEQGESLAAAWPLLSAHPATNDLPVQGLTYRLIDGSNVTWWILRQSDVIATQLSAHDENGNPIIRSRNLASGVETTIDVNDINNRTAPVAELVPVKASLRELRDLISTNKNEVQAILTTETTATAQQDQIRLLRRELIDVIDNVQTLRKQLLKSMREDEVE